MEKKETCVFSNGLIWFGAGISIAEIMTGTLIAPLGFSKGIAAIIIGHLIGCVLLFYAGLIGGKTKKSAMETVKMSFGAKGTLIFANLKVLKLLGLTAVMIFSASAAAASIAELGESWFWSLVIGALVIVWIMVGIKKLGKINVVAIGGLLILSMVLSVEIFRGEASFQFNEYLSFGAAVELSVAMPLSWLPLISDYTRSAKKPFAATLVSVVVYFVVSCWMHILGMGAAIFTGETEIAAIMTKAGLGVIGLLIVLFSTVTTTFLDVYSAGVGSVSISKKLKEKPMAITVCILGTLLAIFTPIDQFKSFLYFMGSVFTPMIAIQISDYFILKKDINIKPYNWLNLSLWLFGFILYRIFIHIDAPIGSTIPVMIITGITCIIVHKLYGGIKECLNKSPKT
ncbi:MAG: putative hydroxymethylpyrimidine transporter CytX [Aminipila sp.]